MHACSVYLHICTSTSSRPHCVVQFLDATCSSPALPSIMPCLIIRGIGQRPIMYYTHKRAEDTQTDTRTTRTPRYGAARNSRTAPLHFVSTHCTPAACRLPSRPFVLGFICTPQPQAGRQHSFLGCAHCTCCCWCCCWLVGLSGHYSLTGVVQTF